MTRTRTANALCSYCTFVLSLVICWADFSPHSAYAEERVNADEEVVQIQAKKPHAHLLLKAFVLSNIPLTAGHEYSHWAAYRMFGVKSKVHLLPSCEILNNGEEACSAGYTVRRDEKKRLNRFQDAFVDLAPYFMRPLVIDRGIELLYSHDVLRPGSILGTSTFAMLQLNISEPLENGWGEGGDIAHAAKRLHVPKLALLIPIQAIYIYSYCRIENTYRKHDPRGGKGIYFAWFRFKF